MRRLVDHPVRSAALLFGTGWIVWFVFRDNALGACFPGVAAIAPFPGDPGAVCQEIVGYVPWILLAAAVLIAIALAAVRRRTMRLHAKPSDDVNGR